ncbi:protein of unknown function [Methanoculleus bourgensis]|uniref:Uncharacterized protein n=1 Tax=Methanoculleus bourgensis TaxID=83986 RepID=A0A0X3BJ84_9EURY|nr:protein of unknown function [Methanoculleus bourgensis]
MDLSNHALTSPPDLLAGICVLHSRVPVVLAVALPEEVAGPLAVLLVELFIAGVALGLLGIWLKERDVAARIAGMSTGIRAARTGSGVPARLPATGTDPISQFAGEINQSSTNWNGPGRDLWRAGTATITSLRAATISCSSVRSGGKARPTGYSTRTRSPVGVSAIPGKNCSPLLRSRSSSSGATLHGMTAASTAPT